ncbi:MAG TPA: hypothetical protein VM142_02170 [Acidimicrobiales bacterium]|nr:hypothetical protein [Acidimicrobiales bacterium]
MAKGADGIRITWNLDPHTWPEAPQLDVGEWLGPVELHSRPASVEAVRRELVVVRVAGDETLLETMRGRIVADEILVGKTLGLTGARFAAVDPVLDRLERDLRAVSGLDSEKAESESERLATVIAEAQRDLRDLQARRWSLETAQTLDTQLRRLSSDPAHDDARLEVLEGGLAGLAVEIDDIDDKLRRAGASAGLSTRRSAKLRKLQEQTGTLIKQLATVESRLIDEGDANALEAEITKAEAEQASWVARREWLDDSIDLGLLLKKLSDLLDEAQAAGLGPRALGRTDDGKEFTVAELERLLRSRHDELTSAVAAVERGEVKDAIERGAKRLVALGEVQSLHAEANRLQASLDRNRGTQRDLLDQLKGIDTENIQALEAELAGLRGKLRSFEAEKALLLLRLARAQDADPELLRRDLDRTLAELGISAEEIWTATDTVADKTAAAKVTLDAAEAELRELRARIEAARAGADRALVVLSNDASYEWLRALRAVTRRTAPALLQAVLMARANAEGARSSLSGLRSALDGLASELPSGKVADDEPTKRLLAHYGRTFTEELGQSEIANALFDGGTLVDIDLVDRVAAYRDQAGMPRRRALESFSSGERAFASTRAQLSSARLREGKRVLLALDEFGAFVDPERLDALIGVIRRNQAAHPALQVVMILPLAANYAAESEAEGVTGERRATLRVVAAEVAANGYFVRPLD